MQQRGGALSEPTRPDPPYGFNPPSEPRCRPPSVPGGGWKGTAEFWLAAHPTCPLARAAPRQEPAEPPRAANPAPGRALLQRRQSGAAQAQPHAQGTACFTSAPLHLRCVVSRTSSGTPGLKAKAETPGGLCPTSTIAIRSLLAKQTAAGQPPSPAKPHCSPAIGQGCPRATQQHMQPTGTAPMFALWFSHTTTPSKQTTG